MSGLSRLRIEPGDANESWKRSEGRTVAEKFQLLSYLAGSDTGAVFLTSVRVAGGDSKEAAIKLVYAGTTDAEKQILLWTSARELNHPNLIRVFEAGRCEIDGMQLLYIVQEYAEENLAQVLPERALTPEEAREMLPPILGALQYLHGKGFVHGHIQPSNILAIGNEVKLSSDALVTLGEKNRHAAVASLYDPPEAASGAASTAADVWQLGITLTEVLTQHLPACDRVGPVAPEIPRSIPEPFREITKHCLDVDAGKRWTIAQILSCFEPKRLGVVRLESPSPALTLAASEKVPSETLSEKVRNEKAASVPVAFGEQTPTAKWPYWLLIAAVVVIALFLVARPKSSSPPVEVQSTQAQQGAPAENSQPATAQSGQVPAQPGPEASGDEKASTSPNENGVVRRVMPQVSPSARRTIQGKIKVRVKVEVDAAGNVVKAKLESAGPSRYFSRIALEAAHEWKFSPAQAGETGDRDWKLQFGFSRAKTEASAVRAKS
ncbi:MAG: TonB family protein [Terriglobales bacterium]